MATQFFFPYWNVNVQYEQFDVVKGTYIDDLNYYYATQDNIGHSPSGIYSYNTIAFSRKDSLITAYYTLTGAAINFAPGSLVTVLGGIVGGYTGMVTDVGLYGSTSGYIKFIQGGWNESFNATAGTIVTSLSPAWTTGFFFIPSYSTSIDIKQNIVEAKLGDGYSQRSANGLNNNMASWSLNFEGRSDKEAAAIQNFVEDHQGVYPFTLMLPVSKLVNRPELKYVTKGFKSDTNSFGLNNVNVQVEQVFDL